MEFSKHNWATILETICPEMFIFGKETSWTLLFQNILTNPIISEISFLWRALKYSIDVVSLSQIFSTSWHEIITPYAFFNPNTIHKPASNNRRILIAAVFHFVAAVEEHKD